MGLSDPDDVLAATGGLWAYASQQWLSYHDPSDHHEAGRWPLSPQWVATQQSSLDDGSLPRERIDADRAKGGLRLLLPLLNGCVASFAALIGVNTIADACHRLPVYLLSYEATSGRPFADRVAEKIAARK